MSRPDVSDPAIIQAFEDVRNEKNPLNWVLYGYVGNTQKVRIDAKGEGTDFFDMTDNMSDGKIHYGFFRFNVNGVFKFVYIAWCGEGVSGMPKGWFNSHSVFMSKFLHGFHVQINARTEEDLDSTKILGRLKTATASHGRRADLKDQSTESKPQTSFASAGTASGSTWKGISKEDSDGYWTNVRKQEEDDKRAKEENERKAKVDPSLQHAGASNVRGQFENRGQQQQQQSAPPPQRSVAPPVQQHHAPPPQQHQAPPPPVHHEEEQHHEEYHEEEQEEEQQQEEFHEEEQEEEQHHYQEESYDDGSASSGGGGGGGGGLGTCQALYDYAGENEGDLAFNEGDTINVLDNSDPSGWWQGEINGNQGFFPSNFVQMN